MALVPFVLLCGLLLLSVTKSDLDDGEGVGIVLLFALEPEQVVIRAPRRNGKFAANRGACVIDAAAARFGIDELARLAKQRILLAPQHSLFLINLRVTRSSHFFRHAEVTRKPPNVARRHLHALVDRTTVGRTINAIVIRLRLAAGS
jgi:hypothetical protein